MADRLCSIDGCGRRHGARGWCYIHYKRFLRHGDPLGGGTFYGEPENFYRSVVLAYEGDECLDWPHSKSSQGYGQISRNGKLETVSRLLCIEINGPPPTPEHVAAHSCGNGKYGCVTKRHMEWKTPIENEADKVIHGSVVRGEKCHNAKLSEQKVREIRALEGLLPKSSIAKMFGVSPASVSEVLARKTWAWVPESGVLRIS